MTTQIARRSNKHTLLVSPSRHLFALKDSTVKWQKKPLDPRTAGDKTLLQRAVLLDDASGRLYGEIHRLDAGLGFLIGFLARAWARKPHCDLWGLPDVLELPAIVSSNDEVLSRIRQCAEAGPFKLARGQGGFRGGIHALKAFENRLESVIARMQMDNMQPHLQYLQQASAIISAEAASGSFRSFLYGGGPDEIPEPPATFFEAVDRLMAAPGAWKNDPDFALVFKDFSGNLNAG